MESLSPSPQSNRLWVASREKVSLLGGVECQPRCGTNRFISSVYKKPTKLTKFVETLSVSRLCFLIQMYTGYLWDACSIAPHTHHSNHWSWFMHANLTKRFFFSLQVQIKKIEISEKFFLNRRRYPNLTNNKWKLEAEWTEMNLLRSGK